MNTKLLIGTGLTAATLSTGAFAASATPADQCTALMKQFDKEITAHSNATKASSAKTLREEGGKMCQVSKYDDGVVKLKQALGDIGVTPQS
jgi:hypothetical protein